MANYPISGMEYRLASLYTDRVMKVLKQWCSPKSRLRTIVTALWLPEEVSIIIWKQDPAGQYQCVSSRRIIDKDTSTSSYVAELKELLQGRSIRKVEMIWILPEEVFPSNYDSSAGKGRFVPILPQWIQDCWSELPASALPKHMVSGLAAVKNELLKWETFKRPGTGFHLELQNRSLFFMFSPEAVETRVSRCFFRSGEHGRIDPDWICQTQGLYQSRSGHALRRILLSEQVTDKNAAPVSAVADVEVVYSGFPGDFISAVNLGLGTGLVYLHFCGLSDSSRRDNWVALKLLDRKRNREQWGHRFRGACALLLLGWTCSLLGACRSREIQAGSGSSDYLEWQGQQRMWQLKNSEWQSSRGRKRTRTAPFSLAGTVASSLPEEMDLERLSICEAGKDTAYFLEMDGSCSGPAASSVFRGWLNATRKGQSEFRIENLKVSRSDNVMNFKLRAIVEYGEI